MKLKVAPPLDTPQPPCPRSWDSDALGTAARAYLLSPKTPAAPSVKIGEGLVQTQRLDPQHIPIALHEQKRIRDKGQHVLFGQILLTLNFVTDDSLCRYLSETTGIPFVDITHDSALAASVDFPEETARKKRIAPLMELDRAVKIAIYDPYDVSALDFIRHAYPPGTQIHLVLATQNAILSFLDRLYEQNACPTARHLTESHGFSDPNAPAAVVSYATARASQLPLESPHPVIHLVNQLIVDAIQAGASDIHIEPEATFVRVRIRVDGVLRQTLALHTTHWSALSHRIKILAGMDIADTRSIQDGRFQFTHRDKNMDCRVAIMPTCFGENIAIRLLDQNKILLSLDDLGFVGGTLASIDAMLQKPEGLVLVTGPTGSGKTTTLYAFLKQINTPDKHVATLEDPVEYQIDMIRQTAINPAQGINFASGVRGLLRMDPDVILIGEIRDTDTAQMAVRAAMTGHKVFSTLHCNDALASFARLADLGISSQALSGTLAGVIAQRLARRLCPHCKKPRALTQAECAILSRVSARNISAIDSSSPASDEFPQRPVYEAAGCAACHQTGIQGRTVLAEALSLTPEIDDLAFSNAPRSALLQTAKKQGFQTMQEDAVAKLFSGLISFSELTRLVDLSKG